MIAADRLHCDARDLHAQDITWRERALVMLEAEHEVREYKDQVAQRRQRKGGRRR